MPVERELKFRVSAHNLDAVASWHIPGGKLGERSDSDLLSTYFDTAKRKLRRHGLTLRVRQNGRTHIQTVKSGNGGQFGRSEWLVQQSYRTSFDRPTTDGSIVVCCYKDNWNVNALRI